jgi:flagellar FliJ protein
MYRFPLQKVLAYRQLKEEEAQARLAQVQREAETARQAYREAENAFLAGQADYSRRQSQQLRLSEALQASEYLALLAERLQACEAELMKQEERLQQQIAETEKAMQERKVMDKLREKDYARYQYRQAQAEQRQTDEIARNVFLRQTAE